MEWLMGLGVVAGMMVLRLAVPAAITLAIMYGLHRLDVRWHPDASAAIAA